MTTFEKKKFAERLKKQRLESGYERQSDLAKAAGISAQAVSSYEACERLPSAEVLASLSKALGCTADYLVQLEDTAHRENADIGNSLGLSDMAISKLRGYKEAANSNGDDAKLSKYALALVDRIVESDEFSCLPWLFQQLVRSMYPLYELPEFLEEFNTPISDEEAEKVKQFAIANGFMAVDPEEATQYYLYRIGQSVANALKSRIEQMAL